ncbi:MAG: DNA repair protein RecN [Candidatus Sericytochromatia bacterium]|nr:DNA repair protein RecN [Candidatus Sericytochromatia bacterium]
MLRTLSIKNFVLMDDLTLDFSAGMCLLTGETGAGKSVLIEALAAALGGRVTLDMIRRGASRATIEATFVSPSDGAWPVALDESLQAEGLETAVENELTLSREITPRGSRCRIDGQLVTQTVLRQIGALMVDVVSQHEHQRLMVPAFQRELLDRYGRLLPQRQAVREAHARWTGLRTRLKELRQTSQTREQQGDFWRYQLREIEAAAVLDAHEEDALKTERLRLVHATDLRRVTESAYQGLYAGEQEPSAFDQIARYVQSLSEQSGHDPALEEACASLAEIQASLKEVATGLRQHLEGLEADPERLREVEQRLDTLGNLSRKYGPGLSEVLAHAGRLRENLANQESADTRLAELSEAVRASQADLVAACDALTAGRREAASVLEEALGQELRELELPRAKLVVQLTPNEGPAGWRADGAEQIEFLISLNSGESPRPLAKSASGGEMARVMLAMETVLAGLDRVPVLVFDEVDTGISGKAALAVAERLADLSRSHQVLCITHLPTVAAMADHHIHLEKRDDDVQTRVEATPLDEAGRIRELAALSSGSPHPAALQHAEALIAQAKRHKDSAGPRRATGSGPHSER